MEAPGSQMWLLIGSRRFRRRTTSSSASNSDPDLSTFTDSNNLDILLLLPATQPVSAGSDGVKAAADSRFISFVRLISYAAAAEGTHRALGSRPMQGA